MVGFSGAKELMAHHWRARAWIGGRVIVTTRHQLRYIGESHWGGAIVCAGRHVELIHGELEGDFALKKDRAEKLIEAFVLVKKRKFGSNYLKSTRRRFDGKTHSYISTPLPCESLTDIRNLPSTNEGEQIPHGEAPTTIIISATCEGVAVEGKWQGAMWLSRGVGEEYLIRRTEETPF